MTKIVYKKRFSSLPNEEGAIILKEICGAGLNEVLIEADDFSDGFLRIGDERAGVVCGVARFNLSSLNDGLYTPIYTSGSRSLLCSPFIKRQGVILRPIPDGRDISRLELLISNLTERISVLEAETESLKNTLGAQNSITL